MSRPRWRHRDGICALDTDLIGVAVYDRPDSTGRYLWSVSWDGYHHEAGASKTLTGAKRAALALARKMARETLEMLGE